MLPKNRITTVSKLLHKQYKSPNFNNKKNPLDEFLYILLSQRRTFEKFPKTYKEFKKVYPTWTLVLHSKQKAIAKTLKPAGLSNQKAKRLKKAVIKIHQDFKELSLRKLRPLDNTAMEKYLKGLSGIGTKTARCIMLYSFDRKVFPVDSNCYRVIKRLGWIAKSRTNNFHTQNLIQNMIKPALRYGLHVNIICHGRAICTPNRPKCEVCLIRKYCNYEKASN